MILSPNLNIFFYSLRHQIPKVEENLKFIQSYWIRIKTQQKVVSGSSAIVLPGSYLPGKRPQGELGGQTV